VNKITLASLAISTAFLLLGCTEEDQKEIKEQAAINYDTVKTATVSGYEITKKNASEYYAKAKDTTSDAYNTSKKKAVDLYNSNKETINEKKALYEKTLDSKLKDMGDKIDELKPKASAKYNDSVKSLQESYDNYKQSLVDLKNAGSEKWNDALDKSKDTYDNLKVKYNSLLDNMKTGQ